jgi:glycosyltransferase involved in cell wall biosynthesis
MPELTYVIPVYNGARSIKRTLSSIIEQSGKRPKIIVVDDGSTDETISVVSMYKKQLTLLRQPNAGPSAARNLGLRAVETEIVCFVDADDYVIGPHRQGIEKTWNKNIDMIIGLAGEGYDDHIILSKNNKYRLNSSSEILLRNFICDNCVQTSTICWSTSFLREIGGWDEEVFGPDDIELAMRAFLHKPRIMISNTPGWVVWHNQTDPRRVSQSLNSKSIAGQLRTHTKLISLMQEANCDRESVLLFLRRCMRVGRTAYLNGFYREAAELFSIAWDRGYTEHYGPRIETILAKLFGTTNTLSARTFIGKMKRNLQTQFASKG